VEENNPYTLSLYFSIIKNFKLFSSYKEKNNELLLRFLIGLYRLRSS